MRKLAAAATVAVLLLVLGAWWLSALYWFGLGVLSTLLIVWHLVRDADARCAEAVTELERGDG